MTRELIQIYCHGKGMEIGGGKNPYCEGVTRVDKFVGTNPDSSISTDIQTDANNIPVKNNSYDYILSAHCLEHLPDTLQVLREWKRIIKSGGTLFLILPHGGRTLDRCRKKHTLRHHQDDSMYGHDKCMSHNEECKKGWEKTVSAAEIEKFEKDWGFPVWDFEKRIENGVMHFHVWTQEEMIDILRYVGFKILFVMDKAPEREDSFIIVGKK